jgi:hypothetical protein
LVAFTTRWCSITSSIRILSHQRVVPTLGCGGPPAPALKRMAVVPTSSLSQRRRGNGPLPVSAERLRIAR